MRSKVKSTRTKTILLSSIMAEAPTLCDSWFGIPVSSGKYFVKSDKNIIFISHNNPLKLMWASNILACVERCVMTLETKRLLSTTDEVVSRLERTGKNG